MIASDLIVKGTVCLGLAFAEAFVYVHCGMDTLVWACICGTALIGFVSIGVGLLTPVSKKEK